MQIPNLLYTKVGTAVILIANTHSKRTRMVAVVDKPLTIIERILEIGFVIGDIGVVYGGYVKSGRDVSHMNGIHQILAQCNRVGWGNLKIHTHQANIQRIIRYRRCSLI